MHCRLRTRDNRRDIDDHIVNLSQIELKEKVLIVYLRTMMQQIRFSKSFLIAVFDQICFLICDASVIIGVELLFAHEGEYVRIRNNHVSVTYTYSLYVQYMMIESR